MQILVTGGAGYIGSHTCLCLLEQGYDVVVVDNLSNSKQQALHRVQEIVRRGLDFYCVDIRYKEELKTVFQQHRIDTVLHFAGLKAVGESSQKPLLYYQNNVGGTLSLLEVMHSFAVKNIVFSSSATVYGDPVQVPIKEDFPTVPTNPYGRTKLGIENILRDVHRADPEWNAVVLRYFNPVGAHQSGRIGEDPQDIPNNLMPYISQVASGKLQELEIFGNDYPTADGTGVRDYIHVMDLAQGHLQALEKLGENCGLKIYNLGTGSGYSVLQMVEAFEQASKRRIPCRIAGRRPGDVAVCYADPGLAAEELGWRAQLGLIEMCVDAWRWQSQNPEGYE